MKKRRLGRSGLEVSAVGLGCMAMSERAFGAPDQDEALATLHAAIDQGCTFFDTAVHYGKGKNEELIARAIKGRREAVVIASKFGTTVHPDGHRTSSGDPRLIPDAIEGCLQRLQSDYLDILFLHRVDPNVPIEETVGGMAAMVEQGKVRYLGLCEVSVATLQRAHKVHPLAALQSEFSLWSRDIEPENLPACRALGIGLVGYSPLGHGFLAGTVRDTQGFDEKDMRRDTPRFTEENLKRNLQLLRPVEEIAARNHCTPAQVAIAWVLAQGDDIVPLPGTRNRRNLKSNIDAADIEMSAADLDLLNKTFVIGAAAGDRYVPSGMKRING